MSHDGRPVRATGARAAEADRAAPRTRRRARTLITAAGAVAAAITVAACSSGSNGGVAGATGTPLATVPAESAAMSAEPSASAAPGRIAITFQEANGSKITGGGSIGDLGDGSSVVTIGLVAIGFDKPLPTTLATGSCADAIAAPVPSVAPASPAASGAAASMAASAAPSLAPMMSGSPEASLGSEPSESVAPSPVTLPVDLKPVQGGSSNTVVQITLADLLSSPASIVVHKSDTDLTVVACADVTNAPVPSVGTPSALPGLESAMPSIAAGLESAMPSSAP